MADRTVGSLPRAPDLYDDSLLVIEQQGKAQSLFGEQLKNYARAGVSDYVEAAQNAAKDAQEAVKGVGDAVARAESARDAAQTAQTGAETAQKAIEDMEVSADTLPAGSPARVEKTARDGHVLLKFSLPTGAQGPQGLSGSSIQKIERTAGTGVGGTVDTYTITLTDGTTHTFQVYNGKDGDGSGDMLSQVYDPQGMARDIFAYADALRPVARPFTLKAAATAWRGSGPYTQTVEVADVRADEAGQRVEVAPVETSLTAWMEASILCTVQGDGTLTFQAQEKPAADIQAYAVLQEVAG